MSEAPGAPPATARFAANLSLLFTELPLLDRPAAARKAGFGAVELWWPFAEPVPADRDLRRLADAISESGLPLVALNFDGGDLPGGDRGLLIVPGMQERFKENVDCVVGLAQLTGTRIFNALYGNRDADDDDRTAAARAVDCLEYAASAVRPIAGTVVIETQNVTDSPRYPITRPEQVRELISVLSAGAQENVGFLADLYHLSMAGLDLRHVIEQNISLIRHVQVADAPGRHEPGTGTVRFADAIGDLLAHGYAGWIAAEYRPESSTATGLGWLPRLTDELRSQGAVDPAGARGRP